MDFGAFMKFLSLNGDFGCGFWVFGCFRQLVDVLGLFLLFCLGLKVLQFGRHCRVLTRFLCGFWGLLIELRNGFLLRNGFDGSCNLKISSCKCLEDSNPPMIEKLEGIKESENTNCNAAKGRHSCDGECNIDGDEKEYCIDEDEVFDVMTLRKIIKMERQRGNDACLELEKERTAATTAAEEAMAMILRLQNEKSLVEMEAHQYRRLNEQKQIHDQGVIQSLRWIVMKHESERSLLEDRLRLCRQKLRRYMNCDEEEQYERFEESLSFLNALDDGLISSLDMGLSP